jgi:hypothetical protein
MEELMNRMHHHSIFIKQLKYGLELKKKKVINVVIIFEAFHLRIFNMLQPSSSLKMPIKYIRINYFKIVGISMFN